MGNTWNKFPRYLASQIIFALISKLLFFIWEVKLNHSDFGSNHQQPRWVAFVGKGLPEA